MKAELLAPAGGKPHLIAAVNSGADAVYMGGVAFNARVFAENFSDEELPEAIRYAHAHGVKVYITLNTLIKDDELARAFEYANYIYGLGIDGLIIQDLGLARLLHKYLPELPLHLSTQGTLYNKEALPAARALGIKRVVPARELSLEEIRELSNAAAAMDQPVEVEVFVHGALCMCYSGQCQMSRLLGHGSGRSGNRGTCAQPCRQAYTDESGKTYYALSPRDLCLINRIPELTAAGASSFKIEGRIKSPEYVAIVTRIYRKYIDKYDSLVREFGEEAAAAKYEVEDKDMMMLRQVFNRGDFTEGYLFGNPGEEYLSGASPKNQGIYLGRVVALVDSEDKVTESDERSAVRGALRRGKILACISMDKTAKEMGAYVASGDGLEFRSEDKEYLVSNPIGGVTTYVKDIGDDCYILGDYDKGVSRGDLAYKVTDSKLAEEALDMPERKLPATMQFTAREGQYPTLVMTDVKAGYSAEITADYKVERANRTPTDAERIEDSLRRLGETTYTTGMTGIDVQTDDDIMMPLSQVNRMRREAADELLDNRLKAVINSRAAKLEKTEIGKIKEDENLGTDVLDITLYPARIGGKKVRPVPLETFMERRNNGESETTEIPYILNVSNGKLDKYIGENFDEIAEAVKDTGILIGNLGWIARFNGAGVPVYADYGLNVFNNQAKLFVEELGAELYMPSHETDVRDDRGIPLMITEHPIDAETLTDRKGEAHRIVRSAAGNKTLIY